MKFSVTVGLIALLNGLSAKQMACFRSQNGQISCQNKLALQIKKNEINFEEEEGCGN